MAGLSHGAYARQRGVSQPYISKLVKLGKIPVDADGKIDPAIADAALAENSDPGKAGVVASNAARRAAASAEAPPAATEPPSSATTPVGPYNRAKTVDAEFAAKLRELDYKQRIGQLIEREAFAKGCLDAAMALGKELEGMVHRLAPLVAGETSISKCRDLIAAEVFRARDAFADTVEAFAADPRDGTRQ